MRVGSDHVVPSTCVCDLGIAVDADLSMCHLQRTDAGCFAFLRQLRSIRRSFPSTVYQSLVAALVLPRLDNCNVPMPLWLVCRPANFVVSSQLWTPLVARSVTGLRRNDHITDGLIKLHWLRVPERINFKLATLV